MSQKPVKATQRKPRLHPRDRRSSRYEAWKRNIADGMRRARLRRRKAGMLTFAEAASELCLPVSAIGKMDFQVIQAGSRRYVRRADVERKKNEFGLNAA